LFWFAVVAVFMPSGPDLGQDAHQLRTELSSNSIMATRPDVLASLYGGIAAARSRAEDPVRAWREDTLKRLSQVRLELATARLVAGRPARVAASENPLL
jgi:hypothetical protein